MMKRILARNVAFAIVFVATSARPGVAQDEYKNPLRRLDLKDGDGIVFLGDSITHQCLYTQYVEDYFYTRFPKMRLKFHNAGVGGATARDALDRFDRDVAAYKPKYVTVLLGMNDGRYRPFDKQIFATYQKDMTEVIARIRKAGATPVLMTPTMYDSRAKRMGKRRKPPEATLDQYNAVLAYYGTWLREVAVNKGYGFVDMYSRLNNITLNVRKRDPKFTLIKDAVHPNEPGQVVMAFSILGDLVPQSIVSSIVLVNGPKGTGAIVRGGKVSGIKRTADSLEFTFQSRVLPWVVPPEAEPGQKLLGPSVKLVNHEVLQVLNMPRGRYRLTIDGEEIGTVTSNNLFAGLQLHNSKKTPQYKQALAVVTLNKKRNEGPVKSLRNEWLAFQKYARLKRQLGSDSGNEKLKKLVADEKARLKGLEERIRKHEQDAKKLEDEIFHLNQPKPRKYLLKKVKQVVSVGTVTLDGKPLPGATVSFVQGKAVVAVGKTNADGTFQLVTDGVPGVPPGEYRVVISKATPVGNGKLTEVLHPRYSSPRRGALRFTVPSAGVAHVDFQLTTR
jgi:lysophospholipase L1-like esterase